LNKAGFTDSKLLGEWRVKAYLAVAKASLEKQCMDEARNILFKVRDVVAIYTGEEYTKQSQAEESVKNLQAFDKQAKKLQRSIEKVRKSPRNQSTTETKKKTRVFGARNAGNSNNSSGSSNSKPIKAVLGKSFLASTTKTAAPLAKKQPKGILASANHGLENHVTERLEI
jgi:cobalamin biosynthesis Mg chelatase CobN